MCPMLKIRVPATSANLGPGFDCLGLALDIWNEVSFDWSEEMIFHVTGEGAEKLDNHPKNLLTKSFAQVYEVCGRSFAGVKVESHNSIPLSSGLGSSASAIVAGIFGANEMLGRPLDTGAILKLAAQIEGHPDNVGAALLGGLVISVMDDTEIITRRYEIPETPIVVIKPNVDLPTQVARSVLPKSISREDALFNIGRTPLVVDALRCGDLDLLKKVMDDRLHQPYRLEHITGGMKAYQTAREYGAAALSGAGPSIICFVEAGKEGAALTNIKAAFEEQGIDAVGLITKPSKLGTHGV
jgi:homoserine kinase